jgi:hypothetical protein
VLLDDDLVLLAAVVEARADLEAEAHRAAHDDHAADEPVTVHRPLALDRHEVLHLADARLGQEARDEDVRVREVELLRRPLDAVRPQ